MRKLKKFKRFNQGGLGSSEGEGDPFAKKTEFAPGQGERNLESIKDFFMGRRSRGEASAPIEERDTSRKTPEPPKEERLTQPEPAKAGTERVQKPAVTTTDTTPKDRGETDFNYEPQRPYNQALEDAKEQGRRARDAFKPAKPAAGSSSSSGSKPTAKPPKPAESSKPSYVGAGDSDDSVETKKKNELERLKRVGSGAVEQTMMGPVETVALGVSKLPAMFRAGISALRNRGTGKFPEEKPEISVPRTPAVERVKEAKIEGPPASAAAPKPKTPAEQMGLRETEPMRRAREAKEQFEAAGKGAKDAADRASKKASDEVAAEAAKRAASKRQTPDNRRFPNKGSATSSRPKASGEFKATNNKFDRPVGEKRGPKTDEVLEREGLPIKKGGKIPAFKKGGLVSRGDGCAQRGKTKCRMV